MTAAAPVAPQAVPGGGAGLRRAVRAFPTLLRIGAASMFAYRAEIIIWFLTALMPVIMLMVWDRVAEGGAIGGYDQAAFARYFSATLVVRHLTSSWVVWELNEMIRTGALSTALLKPVHPLVFPAAENLAALPFRFVILVPLVAAIWLWRPEMGLGLHLADVPWALLALFLGWFINYLVQVCFVALAFWWEQSLGLFQIWFGAWMLLSGYAFPLTFLPPWLYALVKWLPFRVMLGIPVEIGAGTLRGRDAMAAVSLQLAWAVLFLVLARTAWRRGVRRYEAYGA